MNPKVKRIDGCAWDLRGRPGTSPPDTSALSNFTGTKTALFPEPLLELSEKYRLGVPWCPSAYSSTLRETIRAENLLHKTPLTGDIP